MKLTKVVRMFLVGRKKSNVIGQWEAFLKGDKNGKFCLEWKFFIKRVSGKLHYGMLTLDWEVFLVLSHLGVWHLRWSVYVFLFAFLF